MSRLVLYIGGPVDGRYERVDVRGDLIEVAHCPPIPAHSSLANRPIEQVYTRHVHRLWEAMGHWFALDRDLWDLTDDDIVDRLVGGYARKAATVARHAEEYGI